MADGSTSVNINVVVHGAALQTGAVLSEIAAERAHQITKGYDEEHDRAVGASGLVTKTYNRLYRMLGEKPSRRAVLECAAILAAAAEIIPRDED